MTAEELFRLALNCYQENRLEEASTHFQTLLEHIPDHEQSHHILGVTLIRMGSIKDGMRHVMKSIELAPDNTAFRFNLAVHYQRIEEYEMAINILNKVLQMQPDYISAYKTRADCLAQRGRLEAAFTDQTTVINLSPDDAAAFNSRGITQQKMKRYEAALEDYREAVRLNPHFANAHTNIGSVLGEMNRPEESIAACENAIRLLPESPEPYYNKATALSRMERFEDALSVYDDLFAIKPDLARGHNNRGFVLTKLHRYSEAIAAYQKSNTLDHAAPNTLSNLGKAWLDVGQHEAALESFEKAITRQPDFFKGWSNLLFLQAYSPLVSRESYLTSVNQWLDQVRRSGSIPAAVTHQGGSGKARLRIGYVSADFYSHVVSFFLLPLLRAHDKERFEVFCYDCKTRTSDAVTEKFRQHSDHWLEVSGMSDTQLAQKIREDGIDILVDLSGHTSGNRLPVFLHQPAPLQVSYLGYFATTGVDVMDYWITDKVLHPDPAAEQSTETIYPLSRCWVAYEPPAGAPPVSDCPNLDTAVTLASFTNNLAKYNDATTAAWAKILTALPESRLLLMCKPLADSGVRNRLQSRFSEFGIDRERLILQPSMPLEPYLEQYAEVDIILDTFPRTGGTTTAEALWMGVPVVTLAGQHYVERISASKLHALGLEEFICTSVEDYIDTVVALAGDGNRRRELRETLRRRMQESALMDYSGLAACIENAFEDMWARKQPRHETGTIGH